MKFWPGVTKIPDEASGVKWKIQPPLKHGGPALFPNLARGRMEIRPGRSDAPGLIDLSGRGLDLPAP